MNKISKNLEDPTRRHNGKILYWYVNKFKGSNQSRLGPVKDRNRATNGDEERVKREWAKHFENVLNQDTVAGNDVKENEKVHYVLDVKEDFFFVRKNQQYY